jgi:hypothetical protein
MNAHLSSLCSLCRSLWLFALPVLNTPNGKLLLCTRCSGVEELLFAGKGVITEEESDVVELAALAFVDGDSVGKLEAGGQERRDRSAVCEVNAVFRSEWIGRGVLGDHEARLSVKEL